MIESIKLFCAWAVMVWLWPPSTDWDMIFPPIVAFTQYGVVTLCMPFAVWVHPTTLAKNWPLLLVFPLAISLPLPSTDGDQRA